MIKNYFSANLKHILDTNNMSQGDFGKLIGKGRSVVGSYIRGESKPDLDIVLQIADNFGYTLDQLVLKDISNIKYEVNEKENIAAEDSEVYGKLKQLKEIFGIDDNLNNKLTLMLENQTKILDMLDRGQLKDFIENEINQLNKEKHS